MLPHAPRSVLYVPASKPRMLSKLSELSADLALVDLEDGVAPAAKEEARNHLRHAAAQRGLPVPWGLRVNAEATPWHPDDLELARELRPGWLVLPKAESADAVGRVGETVAAWRGRVGLMIESAAGVLAAPDLAADPTVGMLLLGSADLRRSLGATPDEERVWERHAMERLVLAARAGGALAIDGVYFRFRDVDGLARHAAVARAMGYDGKGCIHPGQLETVHRVFATTDEERAWAERVIQAWNTQDGEGNGVVVLDDEMLEALHVELARRLLSRRT